MTIQRILSIIFACAILTEAKHHHHQKRSAALCTSAYNTTKIRCTCDSTRASLFVKAADCFITTDDITPEDNSWERFQEIKNVSKLTLTNPQGHALKFIPSKAIQELDHLKKVEVKHASVDTISPYAFVNSSSLEEIVVLNSHVRVLAKNAFANHNRLTVIILDKNNFEEINRDVFINLPSLEKLFLTSNGITTIHDRAFMHLSNLIELEINMNNVFSLNSETFLGLSRLQKLDLSGNALEVIGDNTFSSLSSLKSLNLESNKIQMLDEKAFHGLHRLLSLSLAHNKLEKIEGVKTFQGLNALIFLSLKDNKLKELKLTVMDPIINNFNGNRSSLDVEDNYFPCDCRLDLFLRIGNTTLNKSLKEFINNLKCIPDSKQAEAWSKLVDKNTAPVFDADEQVQNKEYEYYDETELNGKLFYTDIRDILNCSGHYFVITSPPVPQTPITSSKMPETYPSTVKTTPMKTTPVKTPPVKTTPVKTTPKITQTTRSITTATPTETPRPSSNLLNLYLTEQETEQDEVTTNEVKGTTSTSTTSRLATVSAKPINTRAYEENMASDEAKPERSNALRSFHNEYKETPKMQASNAFTKLGCVSLMIVTLVASILF